MRYTKDTRKERLLARFTDKEVKAPRNQAMYPPSHIKLLFQPRTTHHSCKPMATTLLRLFHGDKNLIKALASESNPQQGFESRAEFFLITQASLSGMHMARCWDLPWTSAR